MSDESRELGTCGQCGHVLRESNLNATRDLAQCPSCGAEQPPGAPPSPPVEGEPPPVLARPVPARKVDVQIQPLGAGLSFSVRNPDQFAWAQRLAWVVLGTILGAVALAFVDPFATVAAMALGFTVGIEIAVRPPRLRLQWVDGVLSVKGTEKRWRVRRLAAGDLGLDALVDTGETVTVLKRLPAAEAELIARTVNERLGAVPAASDAGPAS